MIDYLNWIVANPTASFLIALFATMCISEIITAIGNARRK